MKLTFVEATEILKTGNEQAAWELAQQDDGLLPGTTKEQWLAMAYNVIEQDAKRADREAYDFYFG